jgi:hypothetical protein
MPIQMNPGLAKRLGEAGLGFQRGRDFWLVVRGPATNGRPTDYDVSGPFVSQPEADAAFVAQAATLPPGHGVERFGPFNLPDPLGPNRPKVRRVLVEFDGTDAPFELLDTNPPGQNHVDDYDMVCWSYEAVEKFMVPYYAGLQGVEYTQGKLAQYVQRAQAGTSVLGIHSAPTTWKP